MIKQKLIRMNIESVKARAKLYCENKTFTFIRELIGQRTEFYNGYIIAYKDDFLVFQDRKIRYDFPIPYDAIVLLEPSKSSKILTTNNELKGDNNIENDVETPDAVYSNNPGGRGIKQEVIHPTTLFNHKMNSPGKNINSKKIRRLKLNEN